MNSYVFATSDSTPINFLARIQAESEDEALGILREYLYGTDYVYGKTVADYDLEPDETGVVSLDIHMEPRTIMVEHIQEIDDNIELESSPESGV